MRTYSQIIGDELERTKNILGYYAKSQNDIEIPKDVLSSALRTIIDNIVDIRKEVECLKNIT